MIPQLLSLTNYPVLSVFVQMLSNVSHHTQDMTAGCRGYVLWSKSKIKWLSQINQITQATLGSQLSMLPVNIARPSHLIIVSQASRIFPWGTRMDEAVTLESSSQAPAAWSASVCEIRLPMSASVNLFCLDQMVKALLKYQLETQDKKQREWKQW